MQQRLEEGGRVGSQTEARGGAGEPDRAGPRERAGRTGSGRETKRYTTLLAQGRAGNHDTGAGM